MFRTAGIVLGLVCCCATLANAKNTEKSTNPYLVVSLVGPADPYHAAAKRLAKIRKGSILQATVDDLESILAQLQQTAPGNVAFVVRPDQFDINLVHRTLKIATRVDDDPFIDFNYGFITGRTPAAALDLAEAGLKAEQKRRKPSIAIAGVAGAGFLQESTSQRQIIPLRGMPLNLTWNHIVPKSNGGQRDVEFITKTLTNLEGSPLIAFAGHGFPDQVIGGPNSADLQKRSFQGAVAFNIACYTGVTSTWFQHDWKSGKLVEQCVEVDESFCLQMIDTGVAAYVAYACPRPAGMEMFADMISIATQGISVGEQRRRQSNSVILTHLAQSFDSVVADPLTDGQRLEHQDNDATVRKMSGGGVLFGDPAFVPFKRQRGAFPITLKGKKSPDKLTLVVQVHGPMWFWHCNDPLEQTKIRLQARIPLGDRFVKSLEVTKLPFGRDRKPLRISGATEVHRGRRYLHVKALFDTLEPQEMTAYPSGIEGTFVVSTTNQARHGKNRFIKMAAK